MASITIPRIFDAHVHLREGRMLQWVIDFTTKFCTHAVAMGNLSPIPIATAEDVKNYCREIKKFADSSFQPIMVVMLTKDTTPQILRGAYEAGARVLKYIPKDASTNSQYSVSLPDLKNCYDIIGEAEKLGMIFSGHWELAFNPETGEEIRENDREIEALPYFADVVGLFPNLKIIFEHITTWGAVGLIESCKDNVRATITPQHLVLTDHAVCDYNGQITNPYNYCRPIAKSYVDRLALIKAARSGNPKFMYGSDSAPHDYGKKKSKPFAAGIFTAPVGPQIVTQIFADYGALKKLPGFTSQFALDFYGLSHSDGNLKLREIPWEVPYCHENIPIFLGGKTLQWSIV